MMTTRRFALLIAGLTLTGAAAGDDPHPRDTAFRNVITEARKALPDARLRVISIRDEGDDPGYMVEARRGEEEFRLRFDLSARLIELVREGAVSDRLREAVARRFPAAEVIESIRRERHAERRLVPRKEPRRRFEVFLRQGERRAFAVFDARGGLRHEAEWLGENEDEDDGDEEDRSDEEAGEEGAEDEAGEDEPGRDEAESGEEPFELAVEDMAAVTKELARRFPGARLKGIGREEAFERPVLACRLDDAGGERTAFLDAETRRLWRVERGLASDDIPEDVRAAIERRFPGVEIEGAGMIDDYSEPAWVRLPRPRVIHEARIELEERTGTVLLDRAGVAVEGPFWDGDDEDEREEEGDEGEEGSAEEGDSEARDGDEDEDSSGD